MKKYIFSTVLSFIILASPTITLAAGLTESIATNLVNVVQQFSCDSASPPSASVFVPLITSFSNATAKQAASLINVIQASCDITPRPTANAFVPLLTSFTSDAATNQTTEQSTAQPTQTTTQTTTNSTAASAPTISSIQSKAAPEGTVYVGESPTIYGTGLNTGFNGQFSVKIGGYTAQYSTSILDTSVQFTVPNIPAGTYNVSVTNSTGKTSNAYKVTVVVPTTTTSVATTVPAITINKDSSGSTLNYTTSFGGTISFSWNVTPATSDTTCAAAGNGIGSSGTGVGTVGSLSSGNLLWTTPPLYTSTTYGMACSNSAGTTYRYVNITVAPQSNTTTTNTTASAPVITLTPDSSASISYGGTVSFTWNVTPTSGTTCAAAGTGIGDSSSGYGSVGALSGTWTTPALYTNTTYGMKCTNAGGTTYKYVNVAVAQQASTPAPTPLSTTFSQDSSSSVVGASMKLYWTSTGAASCSISYRYDSTGTGASYGSWLDAGMSGTNSPSSGSSFPLNYAGLYQAQLYCNSTSSGTDVKYLTHTVTSSTASAFDAFSSAVNAGSPSTSSFSYTWNNDLQVGSTNSADVQALQAALQLEHVYMGGITGGFYAETLQGVKNFQQKYGIEATGYVGPATRAKLNALY